MSMNSILSNIALIVQAICALISIIVAYITSTKSHNIIRNQNIAQAFASGYNLFRNRRQHLREFRSNFFNCHNGSKNGNVEVVINHIENYVVVIRNINMLNYDKDITEETRLLLKEFKKLKDIALNYTTYCPPSKKVIVERDYLKEKIESTFSHVDNLFTFMSFKGVY